MKADVDDAPVTSPVVEGAKSPESGARSPGSTRSHDPFGAFPLPQLEVAPPAFGQPHGRRASSVSFGMTGAPTSEGAQEGRGSISPPAGASLQPSPHSHTSHATKNNVYRASRDAFYHHFELDPKSPADASPPLSARGPASPSHHNGIVRDASGNAAEVVRCHQLGVVSLALSYLLADLEQTKGKFPNLRVTHEDIITSLKLPLSYLSNSHLTFHELFAIVTKFVELDERFADFEARAITFDTKRADINAVATLVEEETGRRSSALTTTELRSTISDDGLSFQRIKIACFDAETIAAENVIELDDGDKGDNLLTHVLPEGVRTVGEHDGVREARRRPGTHSGCGIIADINRSKNLIQLLTAVSVEPLKVRRTGVPLKTFHDALSVRNPYSNRAQGIIEVLKKGTSADKSQEGTLNISIGLGSDQLTKVLATTAPDTYVPPSSVFNAFGWDWPSRVAWTGPVKVPVEYHDYTVANHLLTTATALHLLNRTKFPQIDINGLVSTLKLSASQVLLGRTMHCQQWFSMMQHVAGVHNFAIDYLPFTRHLKKPGSPPFLSMEALSQLLSLTIRNTASSPDSEMTTNVIAIASFNGNKARQSLNYVAPGDNPISYAIIAGFDEEAQLVLLVDCDTKRNELHWVSTLDNFYAGLTDHGLLLLGDGPEAADVIKGIIPELDEFTASARAAVPKYIPIDASSLGAAGGDNTLACGTPLSLCALAASRLGSALRLDDLLEDLPCNISHALFPHMSIFDLARLFNTLSSKRGLEIIATPFSLSLDRAMHRKVSLTAFASKLKSLLEEGQQVVVYYSRFLILQAPTAAVESVQLPNYALVLRVLENDIVVLADTNPSPECSVFQVSMMELFKACEDGCQVSRRPKGWVSFAKDAAAMATYRLAQSNGLGALHLKAFSTHPFRPTGSPQLQALAMAFTALGHVTQSSDIFFKVLELGKDDAAAWLLPLSGIRRRLTVETLVKIGQVYASKVLEDAVVVEVPTGSSRGGQLTRDDVSTLLKSRTLDDASAKKEEPAVVKSVEVCIYNVRDAYDVPLEFVSAGVVIGFDAATEEVVIADAEPSSWGEYFRGSVSTVTDTILHEPDDKDYASFGLISVSRKKIL